MINAEIPKLAGIIAYRLKQVEVAHAKFEESSKRNPLDCKTVFYLGVVLSDLRLWPRSTVGFGEAVTCLQNAQDTARAFAEKVATDEQFGERARELLARLK